MTLVGVVVIVFGVLLLLLADFPRRMMTQLAYAGRRRSLTRRAEDTEVGTGATSIDGMPRRVSSESHFRQTQTLRDDNPVVCSSGGIEAVIDDDPTRDLPTSDGSETPGWWLASDGAWYPPEQHPEYDEDYEVTPSVSVVDANWDTARTARRSPPPGWYHNPVSDGLRYWDGASWSDESASRRYLAPRSELPGWWLTPGDS